jgi:hypothetical protein
MQGRDSYEDELARRRAQRQQEQAKGRGDGQPVQRAGVPAEERASADAEDDELPKFGWKDILALIIAAYQILFPFLAILIGAMLIGYLIFRFAFH